MHHKSIQISSKKKSSQKWFKKCIWDGLGLHLGRFGGGLGRNLGSPGTSWAVLGNLFVMLVIGVVFESVFEGIWTGFLLDFEGFKKDFGRIWGGFWEGLERILEHSGCFWLALTSFGSLWLDLACFLLAVACFGMLWLVLDCFGLLWLALACFGLL